MIYYSLRIRLSREDLFNSIPLKSNEGSARQKKEYMVLLNQIKQYVLILAIKLKAIQEHLDKILVMSNDEMVFDCTIHNQITNINAWIRHS